MKKIYIVLFLCSIGLNAQEKKDYSPNVATIDSTIASLYSVISGNKDQVRDWNLFKHLFREDAKLIPIGVKDGKTTVRYMSADDYISTSGNWFKKNDFFEVEIKRDTQIFGDLAQVFSTYEAYKSKDDDEPFMKGINSIQLFYDGTRWWIINLYWKQASESTPIPEDYLPKN